MNKFLDKSGVTKLVSWIKQSLKEKANDADLSNSLMVDLINTLSETSEEYDQDSSYGMIVGLMSNLVTFIPYTNTNRIYHSTNGVNITTEEFPTFDSISQWGSFQSIGFFKGNELMYLLPSDTQTFNSIAVYGVFGNKQWNKIDLPQSDKYRCMTIGTIDSTEYILLVGEEYVLYSSDGHTFAQLANNFPNSTPHDDFRVSIFSDNIDQRVYTYDAKPKKIAHLSNTNMYVMIDGGKNLLITEKFEKYKVDYTSISEDVADIIAANNKIFAITESNKIYYTADGLTWTPKEVSELPSNVANKKVYYNRGSGQYYIASQNSSEIVITSNFESFVKEILPDKMTDISMFGAGRLNISSKSMDVMVSYNLFLIKSISDTKWKYYTFFPHLKSGMDMTDYMSELVNIGSITNIEIDSIFEKSN